MKEVNLKSKALPITIGRANENNVQLTDGCVSRSHGIFEKINDGGWIYTDHSRNGTIVNETYVHNHSIRLHSGNNILRIGSEVCAVQV